MSEALRILSTPIHGFDVRGIAKRFRHAAIFGALDALHPGEVMRFVNDHDPLPLLDQIRRHYGERVGFEYVRRGAEEIVIDFLKRDDDVEWEGGAP